MEHRLEHRPQLDSLRTLAIAMVLMFHFLPGSGINAIDWGYVGVRLFFVLSGFLITNILLQSRPSGAGDIGRALGTFYVRRILRIFPLYYAVLLACFVLNLGQVRRQIGWYSLYLQNWIPLTGKPWAIGHFWSLAVEEQFYLVWPWVIVCAPRRLLLPIVISFCAVSPLSRWLLWRANAGFAEWAATTSCLDSLGIGAVLAILGLYPAARDRFIRASIVVGSCLTILLWGAGPGLLRILFFDLALAFVFAWLIARAYAGFGGLVGRLLENPIPVYLGKISYGIYIYHDFVPWLLPPVLKRAGIILPDSLALRTLVYVLTSIGIAALSWTMFENPINRLKRHFPYTRRQVEIAGAAAVPEAAAAQADIS